MSRRNGVLIAAIAAAALMFTAVEMVSPFGKTMALAGVAVSVGLAFLALVRWTG